MLYSATQESETSIRLSSGRVLHNAHKDDACLGSVCPLHAPTDHDLRDLPLDFNGKHMVRLFPGGEVTVDPDDYEFLTTGYALLRNSARCLSCGEEVVSETRHDFSECACGNVFVDGGTAYLRHGFADKNLYRNTSIEITAAEADAPTASA